MGRLGGEEQQMGRLRGEEEGMGRRGGDGRGDAQFEGGGYRQVWGGGGNGELGRCGWCGWWVVGGRRVCREGARKAGLITVHAGLRTPHTRSGPTHKLTLSSLSAQRTALANLSPTIFRTVCVAGFSRLLTTVQPLQSRLTH